MTSQSPLSPSTITLGIRFQHRNFEGNEHLIYGSYYITGSGVPSWPDYSGHLLRPNRRATVSMGMGNREWILGDIYPLPCDAIILLSEGILVQFSLGKMSMFSCSNMNKMSALPAYKLSLEIGLNIIPVMDVACG